MHGRASEVVETLGRRPIDICCVQESRWNGCSARLTSAKSFKYKFIWSGKKKVLEMLVFCFMKTRLRK